MASISGWLNVRVEKRIDFREAIYLLRDSFQGQVTIKSERGGREEVAGEQKMVIIGRGTTSNPPEDELTKGISLTRKSSKTTGGK